MSRLAPSFSFLAVLLWLLLFNTTCSSSLTTRNDLHDSPEKDPRSLRVRRSQDASTSTTTFNDWHNQHRDLFGNDHTRRHLSSILERILQNNQNDDETNNENDDDDEKDELYIPKCGEIVATLTTQALRDALEQMLVDHLDMTEEELFVLRVTVIPEVDYGIQVLKICGSCANYTGLYPGVCDAHHYAANVVHSGLAMIPLQRDSPTNRWVRGTRPVTILCHGTEASNVLVPSNLWNVTNRSPDGLVLFATLFTSMTATISILPDYTGYGESRNTAYRAYIVRQGYATATLPLIWELQSYIQETSDCKTAMANDYAVVGYSEGGYAAVALAHVLHYQLHHHVIQVRAGGAPLKISTEQLKFLVTQVMTDTFDVRRRYYVAMLAATFSTTTTDVDNYNTNQDLVDAAQRSTILAAIRGNEIGRNGINQVVPLEDPLAILDHNKSATFQQAIRNGEVDPCVTSVIPGETDLLCQALKAQDLLDVVLQAPYDVVLCHSPDDSLVAFDNMPSEEQLSSNPRIELELVRGDHEPAAAECFLQSLWWFFQKMEKYKVTELHSPEGCNVTNQDAKSAGDGFRNKSHVRPLLGTTIRWTVVAMTTALLWYAV